MSYQYLIHLSDLHIRHESDREDEYLTVFDNLFASIKSTIKKKKVLIVFTGDLIHCKTKITPIVIGLVNQFIQGLSELGDTIILPGNHDITVGDEESKFLLDVIVYPSNVTYINKTGEHTFDNITIGASTLVDDKFISHSDLQKTDNDLTIAIGHYSLKEWYDERGIKEYARLKTVDDFKDYDYALLGDIHSRKVYGNCRYAGSLIQQNFSETSTDRGYSILNIEKYKWRKINVPSDYTFKKFVVNSEGVLDIPKDEIFSKNSYIKIQLDAKYLDNENDYRKNIEKYTTIKRFTKDIISKNSILNNSLSIEDRTMENTLLSESDIITSILSEEVDKPKILELHHNFTQTGYKYIQNKDKWSIRKMTFENILKYRGKHSIDFNNINGIIGISGLNTAGKSSLLKILIFGLCGEISVDFSQVNTDYTKSSHAHNHYKFNTENILNYDQPPIKSGHVELQITYDDNIYKIHRTISRVNTTVSTKTTLSKLEDTEWIILYSSLSKHKGRISEKDVNKHIYDMLGRSSDIYLLNIINKNSGSITEMNDICRFNIFSNIFNLHIYNDISDKVKDKIGDVKEELAQSRGKKDQIEKPINEGLCTIDIDTVQAKIDDLSAEHAILSKIINNTISENFTSTSNNLEDLSIQELKQKFNELIQHKNKHLKNIEKIPSGSSQKPNEKLSIVTILKDYKKVNNVEIEGLPTIDMDNVPSDLPPSLKTDITEKDIVRISEQLKKYNYDDDILEKEEDYENILRKFNRKPQHITSKIKKSTLDWDWNISIETTLYPLDNDLKDINVQKEFDKISVMDLKHIATPKINTDKKEELQKIIDMSLSKVHKVTEIGDIIESLKKKELKPSYISRLEQFQSLDKIIIDVSSDISRATERLIKVEADKLHNDEIANNIKSNKKAILNNNTYDEYKKWIHNEKIKSYEPYLIEIQRRLSYIKLFHQYEDTRHKYLQNIAYIKEQYDKYKHRQQLEENIRYFNHEAQSSIQVIDKSFYDINMEANKRIETINKNITVLEQKILAKRNIVEVAKSIEELSAELNSLVIYQKVISQDIKGVILERFLVQVNEYINDILSSLVDYKVELSTNSNRVKLTILRNDTRTGTFTLSAYEEFVLNLTTKIVLNIYSSNSTSSFMILDEALEVIDNINKPKIENLFNTLKKRYQHIILITHINDYFEICDSIVHVEAGKLRVDTQK